METTIMGYIGVIQVRFRLGGPIGDYIRFLGGDLLRDILEI